MLAEADVVDGWRGCSKLDAWSMVGTAACCSRKSKL
jgi:hypothetical protein